MHCERRPASSRRAEILQRRRDRVAHRLLKTRPIIEIPKIINEKIHCRMENHHNIKHCNTLQFRRLRIRVETRLRTHHHQRASSNFMHRKLIISIAAIVMISSSASISSERNLTGAFEGTGRACTGALYVRTNTVEWNSTYSICKPTRYEVLENSLNGDHRRTVLRLNKRNRQCRYEVVEIEHADGYSWNVSGYPSLESFQKRDSPDWSNSPLPARQVLSCLMTGPN
jgi:hypothetical protein